MSLKHTLQPEGGTTVLSLVGTFTFGENSAFRRVVEEVLAQKPNSLIVDLSGLQTVDSAGLSMLVLLRDRMSKFGGTITLRRPPTQVARILEVVDFSKLFEIVK